MSVHIASIDPGIDTGWAICSLEIKEKKVIIHLKSAGTTRMPAAVLDRIDALKCGSVILEARPRMDSTEGREQYSKLYAGLLGRGFAQGGSSRLNLSADVPLLHMLNPGLWKPFMKSRRSRMPETTTRHEKDAVMMLYYMVQITFPNRRINYYGKNT